MSFSEPQKISFTGVRLRFESPKTFDELVASLLADVGDTPVPIDDLAATFDSWESYRREVQSHAGSSGFLLFASFNHGGWITKAGIHREALRLIIGNPLIAITMLRHDVTAGLFAPVELLLTDERSGSALTYVVPSSLMVVEPNPSLAAAANGLDAKLAALATKVTAY
jgi:uncharacterized protein (DUF302 family)